MVTIEEIITFLEKTIAEDQLAGDRAGLRRAQTAAGFLMQAAQVSGDKATGQRFQVLAAHAANKLEELEGADK